MEVQAAEKLIEEIRYIRQQYNVEVGSKGKPWPKSIRDRVFQLIELGFTLKSISDDTGIPYYSILNWRHRGRKKQEAQHFKELVMTSVPSGSVAVTESSQSGQKSATVTVTTPNGYRIEAQDAADVIKVLRAMIGGG